MSTNAADEDHFPAVEELPELIEKVLGDPDMTKSVERHVRWVEGTLKRALKREDFRTLYGKSMRDLLGPGATALCEMTDNGELRVKELTTPPKHVTASQRRRSSILRRLASAAGVPSGAISYPKPTPKPTVPAWARSELHNRIRHEVDRKPSAPGRARLLVIVSLVLDTAARTGELCSLGIVDLAPDLSWVKIIRNPQAVGGDLHITEVWPVSPITQAALANWLPVRGLLVEGLRPGAAGALLVVLHGNRVFHGQGAYKRGRPLRVHGLIDSYQTHAKELKAEVTNRGGSGWELPQNLEQLRRGVQERRASYDTDRRAGAKTPQWGPAVVLNPLLPEELEKKKTAAAFGKVAQAVDAFHQARDAAGDETDPQVLRARRTLREATRLAWARSDHATTLKLLQQAKLANDDLPAAGYNELLLDALERT
ncbi:hypothetical protein [Streptomyces sp. NPDC058247]|uniref:hypothetical protein n=1 Tax=Streptomyces sp. NPDC058247 TaxID=3346401 RepID=UPI0036E7EFC6